MRILHLQLEGIKPPFYSMYVFSRMYYNKRTRPAPTAPIRINSVYFILFKSIHGSIGQYEKICVEAPVRQLFQYTKYLLLKIYTGGVFDLETSKYFKIYRITHTGGTFFVRCVFLETFRFLKIKKVTLYNTKKKNKDHLSTQFW